MIETLLRRSRHCASEATRNIHANQSCGSMKFASRRRSPLRSAWSSCQLRSWANTAHRSENSMSGRAQRHAIIVWFDERKCGRDW